jgi:Terpene synthase family 2, C-terminal metal binding
MTGGVVMIEPLRPHVGLPAATDFGRIGAVAAASQRDLQRCASNFPDLFPANPFDGALFGAVALANAFCAAGLDADALRIANRASLWAFGLDWLIDYRATSQLEVQKIVEACLSVADGAAPAADDSLTSFLAEIRDELAEAPAYGAFGSVWREELWLMLRAMAREWEWKAARDKEGDVPTLSDYLDNSDNHGSSFVDLSHWIFTGALGSADKLDRVRAASRTAQRTLRLLNDLGTYQRDLAWKDLNALMLGTTHAEVVELVGVLLKQCEAELESLSADRPQVARFLERQVGFCIGFYELADYWGEL